MSNVINNASYKLLGFVLLCTAAALSVAIGYKYGPLAGGAYGFLQLEIFGMASAIGQTKVRLDGLGTGLSGITTAMRQISACICQR